jgi:hypothetical protein
MEVIMKQLITLLSFLFVLSTTNNTFSQLLYQSASNGVWSSAVTWLTSTDGGSTWFPAANPPSGSESITVDDTVEVDVALNISGYVTLSGTGNIEINTGSIAFANGSTYEHARNSGGIPVSTWATGSTCKITGVTNQLPANRNQSYYNLVYNCPGQSGNYNMGFNNVTIGGDITVLSTGTNGRWYLCGPLADSTAIVTIMGDLIQSAGQVSSNGSGNGGTTIIIHQYGDIIVSNGNFSISRGSQGGTGTTSWYLHGTNFSMTNVTTQNSNPTGAKFIFAGTTQQNLSLNSVTYGTGGTGGFPVEVATGAILDVGLSEIAGSGNFTLNDDATLQTSNVAGLDSTIKTSGTISLSTLANYTFNGTTAQVTGNLLPTTVDNLTIENPAGVTLVNNIDINANLNINSGDLHLNGFDIWIGSNGTLVETPGNTVTDITGKISASRDLIAPSGVNVAGLGLMFSSTENLGTTLITRVHSPGTGNGNQGILRKYSIDFPIYDNDPASFRKGKVVLLATTLRFFYDDSELNGIPEANLTSFQSYSGANNEWQQMGGTVNIANNYVEVANVIDFAFWTLANINAPIPVELTSFTSNLSENGIVLNWSTATEINNSGWNIERKKLNENFEQDWERIGFVEGSGNSTTIQNYSFTDNDLTSGKYQYRLKQIDFDGTFNYSDIIEVEINQLPTEFKLHQNYPNPFNPSTTIKFDLPSAAFVSLSIYNSIGEKVATIVNEQLDAGTHSVRFDASSLPSGIYIYRLTAGNSVFTNKMLLIK